MKITITKYFKPKSMVSLLSKPCPKKEIIRDPLINCQKLIDTAFTDFINKNEVHEFTITFTNKILSETNVLLLISYVKDYIRKYMNRSTTIRNRKKEIIQVIEKPKNWNFLGVPEFSSQGRFHIHVVIHVNGYVYHINELKRLLSNRYGRCTGKEIYSLKNFKEYVSKDVHKMDRSIVPFYMKG